MHECLAVSTKYDLIPYLNKPPTLPTPGSQAGTMLLGALAMLVILFKFEYLIRSPQSALKSSRSTQPVLSAANLQVKRQQQK